MLFDAAIRDAAIFLAWGWLDQPSSHTGPLFIVRPPVALWPANDLPVGHPPPTMLRSPVTRTERFSPISEYAAQTCRMLGGGTGEHVTRSASGRLDRG